MYLKQQQSPGPRPRFGATGRWYLLGKGKMWPLVGFLCHSGCPTSTHIWTALIGLSMLSKMKLKIKPNKTNQTKKIFFSRWYFQPLLLIFQTTAQHEESLQIFLSDVRNPMMDRTPDDDLLSEATSRDPCGVCMVAAQTRQPLIHSEHMPGTTCQPGFRDG